MLLVAETVRVMGTVRTRRVILWGNILVLLFIGFLFAFGAVSSANQVEGYASDVSTGVASFAFTAVVLLLLFVELPLLVLWLSYRAKPIPARNLARLAWWLAMVTAVILALLPIVVFIYVFECDLGMRCSAAADPVSAAHAVSTMWFLLALALQVCIYLLLVVGSALLVARSRESRSSVQEGNPVSVQRSKKPAYILAVTGAVVIISFAAVITESVYTVHRCQDANSRDRLCQSSLIAPDRGGFAHRS